MIDCDWGKQIGFEMSIIKHWHTIRLYKLSYKHEAAIDRFLNCKYIGHAGELTTM